MKTIRLTDETAKRLAGILSDRATDLEDDGREGDPDAVLLWEIILVLTSKDTRDKEPTL